MASVAIRLTAWTALSEPQRAGLREVTATPILGEPVLYLDEDGVEWAVFDDHRISEEQVALIAALMETPAAIPEVVDVEA